MKDILIIIPAYNEEKTIGSVIENLKKNGYNNILVVDDGSDDDTFKIAEGLKVYVARHMFNRGLGSALATGFEIAKIFDSDITVTFDADGQHDPKDIAVLIEPIKNGEADIVIGTRVFIPKYMPIIRILFNTAADFITFLIYGFSIPDTQSGLRALNKKAYNLLNIETSRMECSSEIVYKIKKEGLKYKGIRIKPIYTEYSLSKGQGFLRGIKTFIGLILNKLTIKG